MIKILSRKKVSSQFGSRFELIDLEYSEADKLLDKLPTVNCKSIKEYIDGKTDRCPMDLIPPNDTGGYGHVTSYYPPLEYDCEDKLCIWNKGTKISSNFDEYGNVNCSIVIYVNADSTPAGWVNIKIRISCKLPYIPSDYIIKEKVERIFNYIIESRRPCDQTVCKCIHLVNKSNCNDARYEEL